MNFFNSENGTLGPLIGFFGQIVGEANWINNTANKNFKHKLHTSQDVAGFGYRYKVRIFGRDTAVKNFSDDLLEMAEVLLPTTAGSGGAGSVQTPNLKQGNFVFGFYKDGIDATEPIIFGVLPNNCQTSLFGGIPDKNFVPFSGYYTTNRPIPVSTKNIKYEGPGYPPCAEGINSNQCKVSHNDQAEEKIQKKFFLPKTINCEGPSGEIDGIQKTIKQLLIGVKRAKRASGTFLGAASDITSNITSLVNDATNFISGLIKSLLTKVRGYVVNFLNKETAKLFDLLPPNRRSELVEGVSLGTNTIQCVFSKIISKLTRVLKKLLLDIIDKYVNAPICAAEAFVGSFLSTVFGELLSGINDVISRILGPIGDIAGLIFQGMDVLVGVLNFLSCEEDLDCQIIDEWSFYNGSNLKFDKFTGKFGEDVKKFVNEANNSAPPCNTAQLPCGPPTIQFFGNGSGASGNPVISAAGYIMGVDLITGGTYRSEPDVRIIDGCGLGNGAIAKAIIKKTYRISPSTTFIKEGKRLVTTINTTGVKDGTVLYWEFSGKGITRSDFSSGALKGEGTVINGTFSFTHIIAKDGITEGTETLEIRLFSDPTRTNQLGRKATVLIDDTSVEPPVLDDDEVEEYEVEGVVIIDPGFGYLPAPNGSTGGDGVLFSEPNETIIGTDPFPPNTTRPVNTGDVIFLPAGSTVEVFDSNGNVAEVLQGQGQTTPVIITENGVITTPDATTETPNQNADSYQVLISINDLAVLNEGVNYSEDDNITITPDNGAIIEPVFGDFGNIIDVNVISGGQGFTDVPEIRVQSESGINAVLVPVFNFQRIDDLDAASIPDLDTKVVNVVDCVGKFK